MKKIQRRDKFKIYGDLLAVLKEEANSEKIVLTHVQVRINLPFDRLKNYITELHDLKLIEDENSAKLTEKGKEFLKEYERIIEFMKRMGLDYSY